MADIVHHYLDYAATAPLRREAAEAWLRAAEGNPSSLHTHGREVRAIVEESREILAQAVGAHPFDVVWTSGGTEADNLAIQGMFRARQNDRTRPYILVGATEHHAIHEAADLAAVRDGAMPITLPVDAEGFVDLDNYEKTLSEKAHDIALISVMTSNNETGARQPIDQIVSMADVYGIPVHSDAVQAFGRIPVAFAASGLSAMSVTAHKIGGPVGTGALIARRDCRILPVNGGGGQEREIRSGTLDPRGTAAFAAAAQLASTGGGTTIQAEADRLERLLAPLDVLIPTFGDAIVSNHPHDPARRAPGVRNYTFPGLRSEALFFLLDQAGVSVSTGAACAAGVARPSHVLLAMGRNDAEATDTLRVTIGWDSIEDDVNALVEALPEAISTVKAVQ